MDHFFVPFLALLLAEFGDKTQLVILGLASRTQRHHSVLLGAVTAFIIADGIAILLGSFIATVTPISWIHGIAGSIFILMGVLTYSSSKEHAPHVELRRPFLSSFSLVLLLEFGDKSQLAAGTFATTYNPVLVFAGTITALTVLSVMALYAGKVLRGHVNTKRVSQIAGILFVVIGIWTVLQI